MMDKVTPGESPEAWRTTLDATSISAKQAADRSGEVLKLMTSGIGEADPLAALSDAMVLMDLKMDALSAKLDAILTLLQSVPPSSVPAPTRPSPASSA